MTGRVAPAPAAPPPSARRGLARGIDGVTGLRIYSLAVGAVFVAPTAFVVWRMVRLQGITGATVSELAPPLWRSLQLAVLVSASAAVIGTGLAWLVVRTDLPLRRFWRVVLVLPLVLPSFVGAAAFIAGMAPDGILHAALEAIGVTPPRRFRGLGPAWLVLTAFTYPYVLLPVGARLSGAAAGLEESARLLGHSAWSTFVRITLPHIRASVIGGTLLVFLYCISEFGAVQLLGYDTLTRVIFASRQVDRATSFTAASALAVLAAVVVLAERRMRGRVPADERATMRPASPQRLGWTAGPATLACLVAASAGLFVPVASLASWARQGLAQDRVDVAGLLAPARSTALVGVLAAVIAVLVMVPLAVAAVRHPHPSSAVVTVAVAGGFAIPGLVIALSLATLTLNSPVLVRFYQTLGLLVAAYVVHFGVQALAAAEAAARSVPGGVRESAALLETSRWRRFATVDLPLMGPNLLAGGGLVLLSTLKELPATLLLSPIGFSTLATTIFNAYEDGFYAEVGVASLVLVAVSAGLTWLLVLRQNAMVAGGG